MALEISTVQETLILLWQRMGEIISAPFAFKEMLFILLPLIVVLLVIELYFGKYRQEKLGWNTAVSNSLVLFFVGMNLLNYLYTNGLLFQEQAKTPLAFIVVVESLFLLIVNFYHVFPREASFGISSPLVLNYFGAASIIMVYSSLPFDYLTLAAFGVLFIAFILLIKFIQSLEAPATQKVRVGKDDVPLPEEGI